MRVTQKMAKKISPIVIVFLVLVGLHAGQSTALFGIFGKCYKNCIKGCVPTLNMLCPVNCLRQCIFHPTLAVENNASRTHHFCKFGCAYSHCSNISTRDDPSQSFSFFSCYWRSVYRLRLHFLSILFWLWLLMFVFV